MPGSNNVRLALLAYPSRKLATSKPVFASTVQPLVMPAQFEVRFWLKSNRPTIVSALRISRERWV